MSKWADLIPKPRSKFLNIKCLDCGNEQVIFSNSSTNVTCNVCDAVLAQPKGGKATIHGEITYIYE